MHCRPLFKLTASDWQVLNIIFCSFINISVNFHWIIIIFFYNSKRNVMTQLTFFYESFMHWIEIYSKIWYCFIVENIIIQRLKIIIELSSFIIAVNKVQEMRNDVTVRLPQTSQNAQTMKWEWYCVNLFSPTSTCIFIIMTDNYNIHINFIVINYDPQW